MALFVHGPEKTVNRGEGSADGVIRHGMVAIARHETAIARDLGKIAIAQKTKFRATGAFFRKQRCA